MNVGQSYDNKAPVAEISLLNLSNWTLWSVTPPHLSLSLSPPSVFLPANHFPSFLTLSTRCPPLPSFCHLRFLFALILTSFSSFHLPVMLSVWLALTSEEFFFSCSVALGSFSVSLFHSHILLLFPLISCLCQNRWFLSSGSSSLVFPPFHPFFFVLPYLLLSAVLSPPFSVLSFSDSYYCPSGLLVFFLTHLSFVWRTINNPGAILYDQLTVSWCLHFLIGFNLHCLLVIHIPKWLEAKYGSYVCVYPSLLTHLAPENHAYCLKFQYVPVHFFIMPQ